VALGLDTASVDVGQFLTDARHGLALLAEGREADGHAVLAAAEQSSGGAFCADDPYEDWPAPLRDEAQAAYLRVLRVLAAATRCRGRGGGAPAAAARHRTGYDEDAHRSLVTVLRGAGRHGEAARARERYRRAMGEIGVPVPR
jgi:DNA-binding SARP family transcriptional activator